MGARPAVTPSAPTPGTHQQRAAVAQQRRPEPLPRFVNLQLRAGAELLFVPWEVGGKRGERGQQSGGGCGAMWGDTG